MHFTLKCTNRNNFLFFICVIDTFSTVVYLKKEKTQYKIWSTIRQYVILLWPRNVSLQISFFFDISDRIHVHFFTNILRRSWRKIIGLICFRNYRLWLRTHKSIWYPKLTVTIFFSFFHLTKIIYGWNQVLYKKKEDLSLLPMRQLFAKVQM